MNVSKSNTSVARFVADAEPADQRLIGARMSLAVMLVASGDLGEGGAELQALRDTVRAVDGPDSVQARNLDRQIARLSDGPER